jgi:hypothetical protein
VASGGWREQYERMIRWHARLSESTAVDDRRVDEFYAFFTCSFHLKNWLKADLPADSGIEADVEAFVNGRLWLRLCADIANGSKHYRLTRHRLDAEARVEKAEVAFEPTGFGPGFQTDEMIVVPAGGTAWDAMTVANGCVSAWKQFLGEKGLLVAGP